MSTVHDFLWEQDCLISKSRWIKGHPRRRSAVRALLAIGKELQKAGSGIEQQIAKERWDAALERLQAVEERLRREWDAALFR